MGQHHGSISLEGYGLKPVHQIDSSGMGFSPEGMLSTNMTRQNLPGNSPFEPIIGFSRAVCVGNAIYISGTGPAGADDADVETQTRQIFQIASEVLERAGSSFHDVVRTRIYLTDVNDWEAVGRVHGEFFAHVRPAATMVVVAKLLHPQWRVEIEFDAVHPHAEGK
jgi:enamine deaminase RidA (YjgF/YER057c/UK114 family)